MNLKTLLQQNDLLQYIEGFCKDNLNRLIFDSYEKVDGGFILHTKSKDFKVMVKTYDGYGAKKDVDDYVYYGEQRIRRDSFIGGFERIPCHTRAEERNYPKVVAWLGTALVGQKKNNLSTNTSQISFL